MRVLIAPDKFKGSLTSKEVIAAISEGVKHELSNAQITSQPLADGGEGSLGVLEESLGLKKVHVQVHDPLFRKVEAYYLTDGSKAFIEMAVASGLLLVPIEERDPLKTTTYGTGELIKHAIVYGINEVNLFVGGSATNDCGLGMARALGYVFLNDQGEALTGIGADLNDVAIIRKSNVLPELKHIKCNILTDVQNPLLGREGSATVYAEQKGADSSTIDKLEAGAKRLTALLNNGLEDKKGAGAAGGLGYGALTFLNAQMHSGIEFVLEITQMREQVKKADLVITGEGSLDEQSLQGKVIDGLKRICDEHEKPLAIICGRSLMNNWQGTPIYQVMNRANDLSDAMTNTYGHVYSLARDLIQDFSAKKG